MISFDFESFPEGDDHVLEASETDKEIALNALQRLQEALYGYAGYTVKAELESGEWVEGPVKYPMVVSNRIRFTEFHKNNLEEERPLGYLGIDEVTNIEFLL